jgi:zinc transporter 9
MSASVTLSIATNTAIAVSKGVGWFITSSPTLFAETVHSLADVGNQILLKVGEVRGRAGPTEEHPFGRGQEKYFWSLVSAVSVFFVGCGINLYHGIHSLITPAGVQPFSLLVVGLILFALVLELWTFVTAWREIGGIRGVRESRANVTVLAVLLEDGVAVLGILLTLLVAAVSFFFEPHPEFDAAVAIVVGIMLGVMAIILAAINRRLLIDASDRDLDRGVERWLSERRIRAHATSLVLDDARAIVFIRAAHEIQDSYAVGTALKAYAVEKLGVKIDAVYWKFRGAAEFPG